MISASPQAATRAFLKNEAILAFTPDMASEIDSEEEVLAEEIGCSVQIARKFLVILKRERENNAGNSSELFARVISQLAEDFNIVSLHGLMCAGGLSELNGLGSQSDIARKLGCTRSLVSYWTKSWQDFLSGKDVRFENKTFCKTEKSRLVFKEKATDPFTAAKKKAVEAAKNKMIPCN